MILTGARPRAAVAGRQQRARLHQPRAGARRCRQGRSAASARSPARATARAAASTARRPTSSPATGGIDDPAARAPHRRASGASPSSRFPGAGKSAFELLDSLGARRRARAARDGLEPGGLGAGRAAHRRAAARRSTLLVVADFFLSETAAARRRRAAERAVGRGRGHDDQPRRPRHPPAPRGRAARRRAHRPRDPARPRRAARARGRWFRPRTPSEVFDELRRATAGGAGRLLRHHLRADRRRGRRVLAVPGRRSPGHAAPVRRSVSDADRPRALSCRRRTSRPPRRATATIRCYLTTGRVLAHYQSGTQTRRVAELQRAAPEPLAEMHPRRRGCAGVADGERHADDAARRRRVQGEADRRHPRGHRVRAVSLGRRAVGQPPDHARARSDQPHARVQGLRRARRALRKRGPH